MEKFDPAFVEECFVDATNTLLALPAAGFSTALAQSSTDIIREFVEAYGYQPAQNRLATPPAMKITAMDEIFKWLALIPQQQKGLRRVVILRSFTHRLSGKPKSWRSIGKAFGADHKAVQQWHAKAIQMIVVALNRPPPAPLLAGFPERDSARY